VSRRAPTERGIAEIRITLELRVAKVHTALELRTDKICKSMKYRFLEIRTTEKLYLLAPAWNKFSISQELGASRDNGTFKA